MAVAWGRRRTRSKVGRLLDEQRRLADRLVGLDEVPLATLEAQLKRLETGAAELEAERRAPDRQRGYRPHPSISGGTIWLTRVPGTYTTAFEQLHWHLDILRADDHGGNRQALGQYWRLVLDALRRDYGLRFAVGEPVAAPVETPADPEAPAEPKSTRKAIADRRRQRGPPLP